MEPEPFPDKPNTCKNCDMITVSLLCYAIAVSLYLICASDRLDSSAVSLIGRDLSTVGSPLCCVELIIVKAAKTVHPCGLSR